MASTQGHPQPPPVPARPIGWLATDPDGCTQQPQQARISLSALPSRISRTDEQALLVWQPAVGTTWNYVLSHRVQIDESIIHAEVWIVDLFDTTASDVAALHAMGRKVVAYFSAGSFEDWRPDAKLFREADLGRTLDGWAGENWLDMRSDYVREMMIKRMDLAREKGFDGIDPHNVDGYDNKNGLELTKRDAVDYVSWLAQGAHSRGLSIGMKNGGDIAEDIVDLLQWCVQEQCVQYGDEEAFDIFIGHGKPVFHVEYPKGGDAGSDRQNNDHEVTGKKKDKIMKAKLRGFSTIIKNVRLDQWVQYE